MGYIESKHHRHKLLGHTNITQNQTLLQEVKDFKKSFQSETKEMKEKIKEKCEDKSMRG
jgi:hypothetical protein